MADNAYDFGRFAQQPEKKTETKAPLRVAKGRKKQSGKLGQTLKVMLVASVFVALACGVLTTQTKTTELHRQIASGEKDLVEQQALNAYLNSELEKMVNLRNIEERAAELGLVKMDSNAVTYIRVVDGNEIEVKKGPMEQFLQDLESGFLQALDYFE